MKLVVCGCSFSSPVEGEFKGTHWAELLSAELGADLIVLARQGVSNNVIRIQIDEAIKLNPDLVIINSTTPDRIEFPIDPDLSTVDPEKYTTYKYTAYDAEKGLKNFNYPGHDNTMVSETIFSIIDWPKHPYRDQPIDSYVKYATKLYASCLFDTGWKQQCDRWILNSGIWQLVENQIPFLYNSWLSQHNFRQSDNLPPRISAKHTVPPKLALAPLMRQYRPSVDPGYHTTLEGQQYIATEYLNILKNRKLI
jgi:hypothetical protein